jgi:anhydro-N-acetylmuramic acid kinase
MINPGGGMRVVGLMSGTSADGIESAVVHISGAPPHLRASIESHISVPYPAVVRNAILRIAGGASVTTAEISRLNFLLGELFAKAALRASRPFRSPSRRIDLIGSHGQTIYHQGQASNFLGSSVASTFQIAEPSVIAERTGIPVIADFRPSDLAAGGQGAPLVPFVDYLLYNHPRLGRIALNIGGIANLTAIPPAARTQDVFAFDSGPGNMLIDALVREYSRGRNRYDRDGRQALRGHFLRPLADELMRHPFLRREVPRSAGREEFGAALVAQILAWQQRNKADNSSVLRTATAVTALTIAQACCKHVLPRAQFHELIVSGGGAANPLMMLQLSALLPELRLRLSNEFGVPSAAKEAFAFAILAYETWHGRPSSLPSSTGAKHAAILGKLSLPARRNSQRRPR